MDLIFGFFIIGYFIQEKTVFCNKSFKQRHKHVFLEEIDLWTKCSTSCGYGTQEKLKACFLKTYYLTENVPFEKCRHLRLLNSTLRRCNYGDCVNGYVWKTTNWSKCSHTCGHEGVQLREVECFRSNVNVDQKMCDEKNRPEHIVGCNRFNCPPHFKAKIWGTCLRMNECQPGKQIRELLCVTLLNNGKEMQLHRAACYTKGLIPPANWRKCSDHIDPIKCNKTIILSPQIISRKSILVQMRKIKKINLHIGQTAYIIPGTKLSLNCPVKNYLLINIIWKHNEIEYRYKGKSENKFRVTRKGQMIIKSYTVKDQGEWICKAGNTKSGLIIKTKSSSDGFKDWAFRNTLWNKEVPNEHAQINLIKKGAIRWVTGPWSQCSVSCDDIGIQSRVVNCENLQNRFYYQLEEKECNQIFGSKPALHRECFRDIPCPTWETINMNINKCTDRCFDYEKASVEGNLQCIFQNHSVEFEKCDSNYKPIVECYNPECFVKWKISSWTKCSRSCGEVGVQARYLMCVWNKTEHPAGNMCDKMKIPIPQIVKACQPPKCHLECVDLSPNCEKRVGNCRMGIYSYQCCKTCREYFLGFRRTG